LRDIYSQTTEQWLPIVKKSVTTVCGLGLAEAPGNFVRNAHFQSLLLIRLAESEVLEVEAQECVFEQTVQRE
jgi:hypothetical protein